MRKCSWLVKSFHQSTRVNVRIDLGVAVIKGWHQVDQTTEKVKVFESSHGDFCRGEFKLEIIEME